MKPRISNPAMILPEAMRAMLALSTSIENCGVPRKTLDLIHLRTSQINGCAVCLDMHARGARKSGETDLRSFTVAGWRDAPYFTDEERAALALTEAVTRLADRSDPVPDEIWNEAARYYDDKALAAIVVQISMVNVWNRVNVATRQVAGEWAAAGIEN